MALVLPWLLLAGCWMGGWPTLQDPNVLFVYVGPVGDHGWTKAHDDGRLYLEEALPQVQTTYEPSVMPSDAVEVIQGHIDEGVNVVFTTSFDFLSQTQTAAANNPDVLFESCSGFVSAPNLGSYFGRMQQVWYLAGMVAGHMTTQDRIGSVGPVVLPETVRHLDAFVLGARKVNPDAVVRVEWIGAWYDIENEPVVTTTLLDWGADVIASETDTTIPGETVQNYTPDGSYPVWSIGYDNPDSCAVVGDRCLTSPYWNWGPLYTRFIQQMQAGTWDPYDIVWEQILVDKDKSTVYLADISTSVSSQARMEVEAELARIADPENVAEPFVGPIYDNQGNMRLGDGEAMSDEDLLSMCWFVQGVVDENGDPAQVPPGCGGVY